MSERDIFIAALQKENLAERSAYLEQACGKDDALRRRVEVLLQVYEQAGSFLEKPAPNPAGTADAGLGLSAEVDNASQSGSAVPAAPGISEGPGSRIGPYKLLQQLGEGGMGAVFMAEQTQPVQRRVALKIIKPGMDSRQVIARFEAERQALAVMDHPNIAKVFDAGTTETGRPYFVMELVKGLPITQYCDQRRLTPKERLELFLPVCQAVQHAHQKGIIHRDLKPSNVLLALYDGKPVPKVIDFGIAKATGPKLTERTLFTEFGQIVGTLEYMSPEQAELNQLDIDTRSDVYSLGVLLYELLTGTTPLEKKQLRDVAVLELLRLIREVEPPKPSTRLSTTDELPSIAANRSLEPSKLSGLVRGELDWVVMKALEKDRNRRYETANSLALDLQRYLQDEPVQACPPSAVYRFRKFARRNKVLLATATALSVAVLVALGSLLSTVKVLTDSNEQIKQEQERTTDAWVRETQAKNDLNTALERERLNSYHQRIALAEREWSENNLSGAEQWLDACPAELRGWEWHYLKRLRLPSLHPFRHAGTVLCGVFSPNGRWIATGSLDGKVTVLDATIGDQLPPFQAHKSYVCCVAFSPDGRLLATAGSDGTAKVWDFDPERAEVKKSALLNLDAHKLVVSSVAFSPDGQHLASTGKDKTVRIWDVATGHEIHTLRGHTLQISCVAYSPDGQTVASASDDKTVRIWDARTEENKLTLPGHSTPVRSVAFSHNGRWLVSCSYDGATKADGEIILWDACTGREIRRFPGHTAWVHRVIFSPDDQRVASGGLDQTVKLWDVQTGQAVLTLRGHHHVIRDLDFSPDGTRLVSTSPDGTVRIWDAKPLRSEPGQELLTLTGHSGGVRSVAYSPDGRWLASVGDDGTVRIWDPKFGLAGGTNSLIHTFEGCSRCNQVVFSHNSRILASAGQNRPDAQKLWLWDTITWSKLPGLPEICSAMAFSPDDKYLATSGFSSENTLQNTIEIRNAATLCEIRALLQGHSWALTGLAFAPKGERPRLASASVDCTVRIWDVMAGKELVPALRHDNGVICVAFSADAQFLASAGHDGVVKIWETRSWKLIQELPGATRTIQSLAFHPADSRMLAWGSRDGTVKVCDLATKETRTLHGHTSWIESVAFSPDGKQIASGSLDGMIKLWPVPPLPKAPDTAAGQGLRIKLHANCSGGA